MKSVRHERAHCSSPAWARSHSAPLPASGRRSVPGSRCRRRAPRPSPLPDSGCSAPAHAVGADFASALDPRVGVDPLSGLFLGTLGVVAAPALVFAAGYLGDGPRGRTVGVLTAAFLLALALVLCARDPLTFLAGWESIALLSATAILVAPRATKAPGAPSSPTWQ